MLLCQVQTHGDLETTLVRFYQASAHLAYWNKELSVAKS